MNAIFRYIFENHPVRVVARDGEPWFVLADVCKVLEIEQPHHAAKRLDDDEKGRANIMTPGGRQEVTVISEAGLYSVVMTSRKPEAKVFKRWVTGDVISAIRKTCSYGAPAAMLDLDDSEVLLRVLRAHVEENPQLAMPEAGSAAAMVAPPAQPTPSKSEISRERY